MEAVRTRSSSGAGTYGAGIVLGASVGALVGACALAGADGDPGAGSGGLPAMTTSSRGSSAASGGGGAGGFGGSTTTGGGTTSQGGSSQGGSMPGGGGASSSSTGPTRSCTEEYGSAAGFALCAETPTYCDFNLNTASTISCGTFCSMVGGACIVEMDNLGDCDLFTDGGFSCDDSHFGTTLCRCTHF